VGAGIRDKEGNTIPVSVKEGDTVLLPEFGGTQVKLGDKEYVLFLLPPIMSYYYKPPYFM
jgi:chaperonin GroES